MDRPGPARQDRSAARPPATPGRARQLAPVLLLADPRDTLVPLDTARRLARALPDARLQLIDGAGHHLPSRAPDAVADAIVAFLAAAEEQAARYETPSLTFGGRRCVEAAVVLAGPLALAGTAGAYGGCG